MAGAPVGALPGVTRVAVDLQTIRFSYKNLRYVFLTPHICQDNIVSFDQGEREKIVPFILRMRPAQISRAGKKRRECPDNRELRGTGLTVAKEQLHISDHDASALAHSPLDSPPDDAVGLAPATKDQAPQRFTATGERNTDPDRVDGLVPPPPKRRRVARAKVSTAAKGSTPTTLGGKLPPVSILSRREFGLRVLRK